MNKKMILLTALIAASLVLQIATAPFSPLQMIETQDERDEKVMYNDIKIILEDRSVGKTDQERLYYIQGILSKVQYYKTDMQNQIISLHAMPLSYHEKFGSLMFGVLGLASFGLLTGCFFPVNDMDKAFLAAIGTYSTVLGGYIFGIKSMKLHLLKKKINNLTTVIIKLEALEKSLRSRLTLDQIIN
jgi:hypothetical protein